MELSNMPLAEILAQYPQTREVFQKFGLQTYAGTETARYENLEASALVHSVDIDALVQALTSAIEG